MKSKNLVLSKRDFELLQTLLINWNRDSELNIKNYQTLTMELNYAAVLKEEEMPSNVVRIGSFIDIETPIGLLEDLELVTPINRNPKMKKLSVFSALGSAVIGYTEGDQLNWSFPMGNKTIRIKRVNNQSIMQVKSLT